MDDIFEIKQELEARARLAKTTQRNTHTPLIQKKNHPLDSVIRVIY